MAWFKGPRCGIDNCASRFYQVLSGQRICQNGHVQVGLETTGDEDDFVAVGQRLARPRSSEASQLSKNVKESDIVRGRAAKLRTLELLQEVFQHQVRFVSVAKHLPKEFEIVSRDLWGLFLNIKKSENISLVELVSLTYLSTRIINFPVLLSEFGSWIRSSDFPYFGCWRIVNRAKFNTIPAEHRRHFRPSAEPGVVVLHKITKALKLSLTRRYSHLKFPDIDDRYVCYKICRDLMFAPQIYIGALRLLQLIDKRRFERDRKLSCGEEIPAACAIVVSAKLYYGLDGIPRNFPDYRKGDELNWNVWRDLMRKLWLLQPDFGRADERLVQYWSGEDIDSYLTWFQLRLGAEVDLDKRLNAIFPPATTGDDTKLKYSADSNVINELCALLHGVDDVDTNYNGNGDNNNNSSSQSEEDAENVKLSAGAYYQMFSVRTDSSENLPEMVGLLYNLIAQFLGADESHVRSFVRTFEKWIKNQNAKLVSTTASTTSTPASTPTPAP